MTGISQIKSAVAQLDTITQQDAALVVQMAASAPEVTTTVGAVKESVQSFRVDGNSRPSADAVALRRNSKPQRGSYSHRALSAA